MCQFFKRQFQSVVVAVSCIYLCKLLYIFCNGIRSVVISFDIVSFVCIRSSQPDVVENE